MDYTFSFNEERLSTIDHFVLSSAAFESDVQSVFVVHGPDNLSDHEPLFTKLDILIARPL